MRKRTTIYDANGDMVTEIIKDDGRTTIYDANGDMVTEIIEDDDY